MLKRVDNYEGTSSENRGEIPKAANAINVDLLIAAARRQRRVVVAAAIIGLVLGLAYVVTAVPLYTATADLFIDSQKDQKDITTTIAELQFDSSAIDSQVEVLKSDKIASAVITNLKLTTDPEFMGGRGSLIGQALAQVRSLFFLKRWFVTREKSNQEEQYWLQRAAIAKLASGLQVSRVGHTYVLAISYTSPSPYKAATIANAITEAYLTDQLDAKYEATRRASGWMQARISELKANSLSSDSAVQKFRSEHGLVTADGKLVSEQQMSELNSQMVVAHGDTARAEARYDQIMQMVSSGQTDGAVTDSLGNPVITELRQKYLAAAKVEAELESKLGNAHIAVINLKREMSEYRRLIFEELQRIAETYKSEVDVSRAKEQSLRKSMDKLEGDSADTNQTMVQLRELEREAESYRSLYQTFLQRYQEAIQQQSFPMTEARVITSASLPSVSSYPKSSIVIMFSLVLGSIVGGGIGFIREYRDRVFRVAAQVRDELGFEFLGMLENIDRSGPRLKSLEPMATNQVVLGDATHRYSIDHPLSSFAETLRSIKVAADLSLADRKCKIIGMISVLPNEGKSTVSINLGSLLAHLGARTLLVDGDLRNRGLTRALAGHARAGLLEVMRQERPLRDLCLLEPESGLFILPTVVRKQVHHTSEILASTAMRAVVNDASQDFDYILIDLPPLGAVVDVRASASMFDGFVFVIEWGRTVRAMAQSLLASDDMIYEKCLGAVFNKVDMGKVGLYETYGSKDYYHSQYGKYYGEEKEIA